MCGDLHSDDACNDEAVAVLLTEPERACPCPVLHTQYEPCCPHFKAL